MILDWEDWIQYNTEKSAYTTSDWDQNSWDSAYEDKIDGPRGRTILHEFRKRQLDRNQAWKKSK
jgi:hypothetical protein